MVVGYERAHRERTCGGVAVWRVYAGREGHYGDGHAYERGVAVAALAVEAYGHVALMVGKCLLPVTQGYGGTGTGGLRSVARGGGEWRGYVV